MLRMCDEEIYYPEAALTVPEAKSLPALRFRPGAVVGSTILSEQMLVDD